MAKKPLEKPENPDIELTARVRMRELRFEEVPDPEVRFPGHPQRESVWGTERENLPEEVEPNVTYRNPRVRLRIATALADPEGRDMADDETSKDISNQDRRKK